MSDYMIGYRDMLAGYFNEAMFTMSIDYASGWLDANEKHSG